MAAAERELLTTLLRDVSRSFYLTLRVLPAAIRPQIGLAYLLARTSDTVADTPIVPLEQRLQALRDLRDRISGVRTSPLDFSPLLRHQGSAAERAALARCEESLSLLARFSGADQECIRNVLSTIISGQELDLQRFAFAAAGTVVALKTDADLDDYTHRVAGCVGAFWTRICLDHLYSRDGLDRAFLMDHGVRFGKGLQLVNILRDLPLDLRQGRCYLPQDRLVAAGLAPTDLTVPANAPRFRTLYGEYLDRARAHLAAGWAYTNHLPRRGIRVRLACAWPVLIGARTLSKLRVGDVLDPAHRIKVSRGEVKAIIVRTLVCYPWAPAWRRLFPSA